MISLIKYEWKKIWESRLSQLAMLGCSLFLIFCVYSSILQITATGTDGTTVNGMDAVKVLKQTRPQENLTQKKVNEVVNKYLGYLQDPRTNSDNPELKYLSKGMYQKFYLPNKELLGLIANNYNKVGNEVIIKDTFEKNVGKDFYKARSEKTEEMLNRKIENGELTSVQANYWLNRDGQFKQYTYGYCEGWRGILSTLTWPVLIMMIVCIGIAPMFAGEYQTKCDSLILCMRYGKTKLVLAKVLTAWLYTTAVYGGITILYSAVYLGVLGSDGGNLPIQIHYPAVPVSYNLNMSQACVWTLIMGYILTLGMMGITLLMSSLFKNMYGVIIVAFLMLIIPTFLSANTGGYVWRHLLALVPSKISDFSYEYYTSYTIGGRVFSWLSMTMLVNGILAVVFSGLSYYIFSRHQVNK